MTGKKMSAPGLAALAGAGIGSLWNTLMPRRCPLCRELLPGPETEAFCPVCAAAVKEIRGTVCEVCGRRLSSISSPASGLCGFCGQDPPVFDRARAYGYYEGVLREAISGLKFQGQREFAPVLARLTAMADRKWLSEVAIEAVIPVPLHVRRLRERGFNQAADLARPVARQRGVPVLHRVLQRTRSTEPQYGLSLAERKENLRGAFAVRDPDRIAGRPVLVVDDILTTGTTARECAKTLLAAGASKVIMLTLARSEGE